MSSTARLCATLICGAIFLLCQSKSIAFPLQSEIQPNDQNGGIYGYARGKNQSAVAYTEVFHDDPLNNTLRVSYWSGNRKAISYKTLTFGDNPKIPNLFEFIDFRDSKAIRITVNGNIANVKSIRLAADGSETVRSEKNVEISANTVIDASFHRFILSEWDRMIAGESMNVKFMRLDKASLVPLVIKRYECDTANIVCFKVSIDNLILQTMLPSFFMQYDLNKNLIRYNGIGPITKANGKPQTVDISYEYPQ